METVLKAGRRLAAGENEFCYKNTEFKHTVRGLDISYMAEGSAFELDVCVNGEVTAVAALTATAGYRDTETVHVYIPEIQSGTYDISFRTNVRAYFDRFIFTETDYRENAGTYVPCEDFRETDNDLITATDSLGRKLPDASECGGPKKRAVGLFYWTWRNQSVYSKPISLEKVLKKHPEAEYDINHPAWTPGETVHWSEPFYGFYRNDDPYVIRKHAQYFADAGVDALLFDTTNGALVWKDSYMALLEEFHKARKDGIKTPQVAFIMNFAPMPSTLYMLRSVYQDMYKPGLYRDLWYMLDGKPLVLAYPESIPEKGKSDFDTALLNEMREFFTFRAPQPMYAGGPSRPDHWGWLEKAPQNGYVKKEDGRYEMCTVGVGQNARDGRICTHFNDKGTYGRSYTEKYKHTKLTPESYKYGYNIQEQWDNAFKIDPDFVFVTGWNEWIMGKFPGKPWIADDNSTQIAFVDQYDKEHSRDIEPDKDGYKDLYYMQLVANIRKYKGLRHIERSNVRKKIDISDFSQWDDVKPEYYAHKGSAANRDYPGLGRELVYRNKTGINDFTLAKYAYDDDNIYFYIECAADIKTGHANAVTLLLDTDRCKDTGWEGYDYKITAGKCFSMKTGSSEYVGDIETHIEGNKMALKVPRSITGSEPGTEPGYEFKWIDNVEMSDVMEFYRDGDCAPFGRFNYVM